jgi:hypothetical protein
MKSFYKILLIQIRSDDLVLIFRREIERMISLIFLSLIVLGFAVIGFLNSNSGKLTIKTESHLL